MNILMISAQGGDIITARPVSDAIAGDIDKIWALHLKGEDLELTVEFVAVEDAMLQTTGDCERFIQQISDECDEEDTTDETETA